MVRFVSKSFISTPTPPPPFPPHTQTRSRMSRDKPDPLLGVSHVNAIQFKFMFDHWISDVGFPTSGVDDSGGMQCDDEEEKCVARRRVWPSTWPSEFTCETLAIPFGHADSIVPFTGTSRSRQPVEHYDLATSFLIKTYTDVGFVTDERRRDIALARMLIAGVNGHVGAFLTVALLDMMGVRSSHARDRVLTPRYMQLVLDQVCCRRSMNALVFAAHALVLQLQYAQFTLCTPGDISVPGFGDFNHVIGCMLACDALDESVIRRKYPSRMSLYIRNETFNQWPVHLQQGFSANCAQLPYHEPGYEPLIDYLRASTRRYASARDSRIVPDDVELDDSEIFTRCDRDFDLLRRVSSEELEQDVFVGDIREQRLRRRPAPCARHIDWDAYRARSMQVAMDIESSHTIGDHEPVRRRVLV